jgi:hypothetical protein
MDIEGRTLAETDCCGHLFETWTGRDVAPARVQGPALAPLSRIAAQITHFMSATASLFVLRS